MARYVRDVQLDRPEDFVQYIMNDFLTKHGFQLVQFKGEQVYRAGGGLIEVPKFLVWSYQNGVAHIEAWTRDVWFPGVYGKEKDMTGFTAAVPKANYKKDIEELVSVLCQPLPDNGYPQTGNPGDPNGQQTIFVRGVDMSRHATMGFVFSLISILGVVLFYAGGYVVLGYLLSILGIAESSRGRNSQKRGLAITGLVISIITLVIDIILTLLMFLGAAILLSA